MSKLAQDVQKAVDDLRSKKRKPTTAPEPVPPKSRWQKKKTDKEKSRGRATHR